ncbi:DEAD/DEAH box helicase [Agriterribacter sp.]|uniref:DEAD/DEAH box helicase n=1 Tax=Agriterribacter sp. TaxID=2821509 RepID=UPI002BA670A3|nr:DEAD/DEAH box helicase [Agriterribacter sp.]HRO46186.1 DEAD/DEAH box helicase [Agriterribacter sp.]HRQ16300.1 DEAD/DEAH box helicase [Agriterribacter sp.]
MQFKAGYIADTIAKVITTFKSSLNKHLPQDKIKFDQINGLLQHVSAFEVEFPYHHNPNFKGLHPVLVTLNNIITRGLPTRSPIVLENIFAEIGLIDFNTDESVINFPESIIPINYKTVFELLHIIEPKLEINRANYGGNPGSNLEWEFIEKHPFLKQILESQRDFSTINERLVGGRTVDFCFTSPYLHWVEANKCYERIGRIFEIDGHNNHFISEGRYYDGYRDAIAEKENFETIRFTVDTITQRNSDFEVLIGREVYQHFKNNFERDISKCLTEYSLIFIPFAVARIQKAILEFLLVHPEFFKKEKIKLAVVERDFPCGAAAIKSLQELFENLNALLDEKDKLPLPEIELTIYETEKWVIDRKLHFNANIQNEKFFSQNYFDIVVDHSILRRSNIYNETDFHQHKEKTIKIRSAHYYDTSFGRSRRTYCADLLHYKQLVRKKADGSYEPVKKYGSNINFFIQNIFRKVSFREGQLPIISRALEQKPVIGLLPTGGGKSLTFQLPAFLQPGLCLVVDPIKSLMEDQVRVLKQNWIDCCDFINSNLRREDKVKKLVNFRYGETMFLFISPERFVMQDFRNIIQSIDTSEFGLAFSYCVIDEVHCVSEWGHDFRSTYLMLGKNAQKFAKTRNGKSVSLIGLTATASFDVLADIERELKIRQEEANDAIISIDNTIRPELFFNIIENEKQPTTYPVESQDLKNLIGASKQELLNNLYENLIEHLKSINEEVVHLGLEQHFTDFEIDTSTEKGIEFFFKRITKSHSYGTFYNLVTIIFCPHITGSLGITQEANSHPNGREVFENLIVPDGYKGYFMGGDDRIPKAVVEKIQNYFLNFLEGKVNTMVCTKAFGMGIDKENIRSVNHINFSSSPESYIQEAGRAGRDKAKSICTIFLDSKKYYTTRQDFFISHNPKLFPTRNIRKKAREIIEAYSDFLNRIQKKYYQTEQSLLNEFNKIGVRIEKKEISEFNLDKSIHDYFHNNNFKGIDTEICQLHRLFNYNQGINTSQLKLIVEKYNFENDDAINLNLTIEGPYQGNMLVNSSTGAAIGKIRTTVNPPFFTINGLPANQSPDSEKAKHVLSFIINEWRESNQGYATLFEFLTENIIEGLNKGLSLIEFYNKSDREQFEFKVPTNFEQCNIEARIARDINLGPLALFSNYNSTEDFLTSVSNASYNFEDFILRVEEIWDVNIFDTPVFAKNRKLYKELYYSDIKMSDVSRMLYRFYSVGFIDNYTVDYNLGLFTFNILKREKAYFIEKTEEHMLKYLSRTETLKKIEELINETADLDTFETIKKCIRKVLEFTYEDIVRKRKEGIDELFSFITNSQKKAAGIINETSFRSFWYNYFFKEEMYYYFNAKYSRPGFRINNEPYSLTDDTDKGRTSSWEDFIKYAKLLVDQSRFIAECKMMRGSCKRIWRTLAKQDYEHEYTLKILYAFATFGLNNKFYYSEAEDYLIEGFCAFYKETSDYDSLKRNLQDFEILILRATNNTEYKSYLDSAMHHIMLLVNSEYTKNTIKKLEIA